MKIFNALLLAAVMLTLTAAQQEAQVQDTQADQALLEFNKPSKPLSFKGHQVVTVEVRNQAELDTLVRTIQKYHLDEWSHPKIGEVDLRIPPELSETFKKAVRSPLKVKIADLGAAIEEEAKPSTEELRPQSKVLAAAPPNLDWFKSYKNLAEHQNFIKKLNADYASITEVVSAGKTYENRDITGLRIKGKNAKKTFIIHGGIHAREWITPATVAYLMNALAGLYGKDQRITNIVDNYDTYVFPILNADGYVFTQSNRMWRKNRQPNGGSSCVGTDVNRNWAAGFGGPGASNNPCDETYHGPSAFSSPEARAMSQFISAKRPHVYFDIHSYSQLWMWPYGYKCSGTPPNGANIEKAGRRAAQALQSVHGTQFTSGPICTTIYQASGSTVDWAVDKAGVAYPYTLELRDKGRYGFVLPANQIIPSGEETLEGILTLLEYALGTR
ncbi:uncharacterized protein VTP21DRAFT_2235 [Calcarisporiella thermophila]|uniref:uncharacterized protein n=1 Tax=Calcarisporiella thermophila TaxID=911321 RepID=UPI0037439793